MEKNRPELIRRGYRDTVYHLGTFKEAQRTRSFETC